MFRLQRRAVAFTRIGDRGEKSLTFEVNTALRIHSTHPEAFAPALKAVKRRQACPRRPGGHLKTYYAECNASWEYPTG
jgi:hypothetical protein